MKNVTGGPAEDDDFFDRPDELKRLLREIDNRANTLLVAPRRVGKTSLVLRLCELVRSDGSHAVFINVEGCHDELSLAEKLVDGLRGSGLQPEPLTRMSLLFGKARKALTGFKVGAAGVDMEIDGADDPDHSTLGRAVESIFRNIEGADQLVVIAIDELPELLLALRKDDHGVERVTRLLHWLRSLRQTYRKNTRWIFLGSIGLDTFVDEHHLRKAINDLTPIELNALTPEEAHDFLQRLGNDNGLPLSPDACEQIIARVGWPLPHHLQLVFHGLIDSGAAEASAEAIDAAFAHLLQPAGLGQFDTWRHRLDEQFTASDAALAKTALRHICQHPNGRNGHQIIAAVMAKRPTADPEEIEEQLRRLLMMLQRDGYLLESHGTYSFRSFLLREYWHKREAI